MGRGGRCLLVLAVALLGSGCGLTKRPYAHDPLLRHGHAVWGDHGLAHNPDLTPHAELQPPRPPMPVDLPTLEWEVSR